MLEAIVASVRREIASRPRTDWEREIENHRASALSKRSFIDSISKPGEQFILEIKRKAPSSGALAPDLNVEATAEEYCRCGAAAISVLTEHHFFGGSCEDLRSVSRNVAIPTLRKDFIIDELQICEAAAWGASAVLLIVAILSEEQLRSFLQSCSRLNLDALVEVHDEHELQRAMSAGAGIIGVNNRNLKTMQIDLAVGELLLGMIPDKMVRVAESGISKREDVVRLRDAGANAFLIGTSIMRAENFSAKIQELRGI